MTTGDIDIGQNIYARIVIATIVIGMSVGCIKIYYNRGRNNIWGEFHSILIRDKGRTLKLWHWEFPEGKWLLYFGVFGILLGLLGLLFGFSLQLTTGF